MKTRATPPNEPGKWKLLEDVGSAQLWRRDRSDPAPVTMYYLVRPPHQAEVYYNLDRAEDRLRSVSSASRGAPEATDGATSGSNVSSAD